MNEAAQSSPMDLLKPASGSSKKLAGPFSGFGNEKSTDTRFSRELTRASDRAEGTRLQSARTERNSGERDELQQADKANTNRDPDSTEPSDTNVNSKDRSQDNTSASSDRKDSTAEKAEQSAPGNRDEGSASKDAISKESKPSEGTEESATVVDAPVSDTATPTQNTDTETAVAATLLDGDTKVVEDASDVIPAEVDTVGNASKNADESQAVGAVVRSSTEQAQTARSAIQNDMASATASTSTARSAGGNTPAQSLTAGEQLSPAELATRQTQLLGQPSNRERQSNLAQTVAASQPGEADKEAAALRVPAANLNTALLQTGQTGIGASQRVVDSSQQALDPRISLVQGVADRAASDEQLKSADLKASAELNLRMAAQRNDQQVMQANLAQMQLQARQQATQALANATTSVPATDSAGSANVAPDNMFLSLPGGIVTAPVLQRADAAATQVASAPVNLPILQGDADKALAGNIRWMANEGVKNALINVTPSGMGPISVKVSMENDLMNVSIVASQGSTREALDSMLPRLREQLAAQGHDSVRVDISDGRSGQSDRGYAQQGSDDRQATDRQLQETAGKVDNPDEEQVPGRSEANHTEQQQNLLTEGSMGQFTSRYDVYV